MPRSKGERTVVVMSSRQMPTADAAWLHMDRPMNPMVVNSVVLLDEPLDLKRGQEFLQRRLVEEFPRSFASA
jgi:diacylglycerol O-acyltransferase / wax synthase